MDGDAQGLLHQLRPPGRRSPVPPIKPGHKLTVGGGEGGGGGRKLTPHPGLPPGERCICADTANIRRHPPPPPHFDISVRVVLAT